MKLADVPQTAYSAPTAEVPTKVVPDWDAMYVILQTQPYVVLDVPEKDLRHNACGTVEAPIVKALNNHVRTVKRRKLLTKRLTATRWLCMLDDSHSA